MRIRERVDVTGDAATQDFGHNRSGVAGTINAKISELIGREALGVERAKAGFVAEEGTPGHGHAAGEKDLDGCIEPDDGDAGIAQEFGGPGLGVSAAAEGEDGGLEAFGSPAQGQAKLIGFQLAESGFAMALKKFRYGNAGNFLDSFVEINETPAELFGEAGANRAFAGTHETGEADNRCARWRTANAKR
jgi:hypothetical protein